MSPIIACLIRPGTGDDVGKWEVRMILRLRLDMHIGRLFDLFGLIRNVNLKNTKPAKLPVKAYTS